MPALFNGVGKKLVFPGATVRLLPGEVEETLAPDERLTAIRSGGPHAIAGIVRPPAAGQRWIAFFYGNAMTLADTRLIRDQLSRDGDGVVCVDYAGFGLSGGQPSEAGCYQAADAAMALIRQEGGREGDTAIVGWSMGSSVAVDLAARSVVRRVVLLSPLSSLAAAGLSLLLGRRAPRLDRGPFSCVQKAAAVLAPTLLIVGAADALTPPPLARAIRDKIAGPTQLEVISGAEHNDLLATASAWELIRAFLDYREGEHGQP